MPDTMAEKMKTTGINGEDHRGHVPLPVIRGDLVHGGHAMPRGKVRVGALAERIRQRVMTARRDLDVNVDVDCDEARDVDHLLVSRESG